MNVARDPGDLYEVSPDAPELDDELVMLYYLDGFIDAGGAGRLLAAHLLSTLEHNEIARFDVDALIDYRSRRPTMTFTKDHWEQYEAPEITVSLLHDAAGTPFLLLNGPEPDREWEAFTAAVRQLSAALGVRLAISFHGIPMGVPHTRPLGVTAHATQPEPGRRLPAAGRPAAGPRQRDRRCSSCGWARTSARPSASRCTCRTTWPRPPTRRPP